MIVADIINRCNTGLARGLNIQLIEKMNRMVNTPILVKVDHPLIDTSAPQVNPYLQPAAAGKLAAAATKRGKKLILNSCLRTTVQQHIIRRQFKAGICGITAAALPGRSNHEDGAAIDVQNPQEWQLTLELCGWKWLGAWDAPHYDFWDSRKSIASLQISAFQMLWNQYNPRDLIPVDGTYGPLTGSKIDQSPIDGWK
jgi:N-acetylmuramoyl-L-alanine amidase